ncbi:glycosyltransferase family 2 protein [Chelatococcus composti]|uniref:Glycosyltransferase involved in cell wall biosynthesis n=1 Tax=Chelatococcus composti TaxID=1743235 RepID=A0A841K5D2_9HYPH|nr:glycosyltransferase family 2 protein [Chelatococcus composti]MBB6168008.1 glycosyltransferase involved in cell wall biosynthesis [Chelatococcus composti]MBS7734800.1 glycosyltransferase family 2 protein [Chelatococcus composti]PZN44383.1 MAG: glycosyltransferase family 2 protein [Pseudomonadota bacterium]GGG34231.1 putative glycosyltransferase RP128 [Chelatococcus composti]
MSLPLSIFVIAHNEADRIGRTLAAVRHLTDDLVVVDSGSTDETVAVAEAHGARVIFNPWPGYGPQKRFAEDQCRHQWLFNIDADEVVPPDLAAEIAALFANGEPPADAYETRIAEIFPGEAAPHRFAYALAPVRLYRRDKGRYSDSTVHDRVVLAPGARVRRLKGTIHHFSVRSLGDQLAKLNSYTDAQADNLEERGERVSILRLYLEFPAAFLKAYIGRRHFVRGVYGFMTAMNFAFYRYLRIAKHIERRLLAEAARKGRLTQ